MKDSKKDSKGPRPNMKNKDFVKWSKAETCKHDDNIQSTEWHEKLKRLQKFDPVYDNKPVNMVYLLSMEYGRIWQKERDEWYKNVFVPEADQQDMDRRKKKVRMEARAAKKAAEAEARERKQRRAKELEAKAKAEAEKLEKLRERVRKLAAPKSPGKAQKKQKKKETKQELELEPEPAPQEEKSEDCSKGCKPMDLTHQCECSDHKKGDVVEEEQKEGEPETSRTQESNQGCTMCDEYIQQLQDIHEAKIKEGSNIESHKEHEMEIY